MAVTGNEKLVEVVVPRDNLTRAHFSAFHFRFWRLGCWLDVIVDDLLPVTNSLELVFSSNKIHPNEFWLPLFEKAFDK